MVTSNPIIFLTERVSVKRFMWSYLSIIFLKEINKPHFICKGYIWFTKLTLRQWFSNLSTSITWRACWYTDCPTPQFLIQEAYGGAWQSGYPTSPLVTVTNQGCWSGDHTLKNTAKNTSQSFFSVWLFWKTKCGPPRESLGESISFLNWRYSGHLSELHEVSIQLPG